MEKNLTNYYKDFVLKLEDGNTQTYSSRASNRGGTIKFLFLVVLLYPQSLEPQQGCQHQYFDDSCDSG